MIKAFRLSAAAIGMSGLLLTSSIAAADGVAGFEAYEKGDYATALKEFMPLAESGQASAEAAVGQMYFEGKGVKPDMKEAARWLEPAASKGIARAQFLLGKLYLSGEGVASPDPVKAAALTKAAADQGLVEAQVDTCAFYYQGVGVPKDLVQAYLYANLAAQAGSEDGRSILTLLSQDMKPEDVAKGEAAVRAWKPVLPDIQDPNVQ
ncbi:tetratricopeptide repeat protein [Dongia sedimenti]|uniref:Tetratricopeptide repeat protein n=1 Tax=Dongia sedimenti TaxID=3064282 RepID=A0ABU0YJ37_9PROT|nr:tetratricopeptide repeat protein [Rhodospirillaceae bacterium R-7]